MIRLHVIITFQDGSRIRCGQMVCSSPDDRAVGGELSDMMLDTWIIPWQFPLNRLNDPSYPGILKATGIQEFSWSSKLMRLPE